MGHEGLISSFFSEIVDVLSDYFHEKLFKEEECKQFIWIFKQQKAFQVVWEF